MNWSKENSKNFKFIFLRKKIKNKHLHKLIINNRKKRHHNIIKNVDRKYPVRI